MYYNNTSGRRFLDENPPPLQPPGMPARMPNPIGQPYLAPRSGIGPVARPRGVQRFQPYGQPIPPPPRARFATGRPYAGPPFQPWQGALLTPHAGMHDDRRICVGEHRPDDFKRYDCFEDFDSKGQIKINVVPSSTACKIQWLITSSKGLTELDLQYRLSCNGSEVVTKTVPTYQTETIVKTIPGQEYTVELILTRKNGNKTYISEKKEFKAMFNLNEVNALFNMARLFVGAQPMQMFTVLYRCKPRPYFDDVLRHRKSVMEKYIKDENGHRASPINGRLRGLFFTAEKYNGQLPTFSPFGDTRIQVPADKIIRPGFTNIYFVDFYCNTKPHYVTVVLCQKGSNPDDFCKRWTKPLNALDNPFLKVVPKSKEAPGPDFLYFVNNRVHVEICYTENVPLSLGVMDVVQPLGRGSSRIGGLPNNTSCTICNFTDAQTEKLAVFTHNDAQEPVPPGEELPAKTEPEEDDESAIRAAMEEELALEQQLRAQPAAANPPVTVRGHGADSQDYDMVPSSSEPPGRRLLTDMNHQLDYPTRQDKSLFGFLPLRSRLRARLRHTPATERYDQLAADRLAVARVVMDMVETVGRQADEERAMDVVASYVNTTKNRPAFFIPLEELTAAVRPPDLLQRQHVQHLVHEMTAEAEDVNAITHRHARKRDKCYREAYRLERAQSPPADAENQRPEAWRASEEEDEVAAKRIRLLFADLVEQDNLNQLERPKPDPTTSQVDESNAAKEESPELPEGFVARPPELMGELLVLEPSLGLDSSASAEPPSLPEGLVARPPELVGDLIVLEPHLHLLNEPSALDEQRERLEPHDQQTSSTRPPPPRLSATLAELAQVAQAVQRKLEHQTGTEPFAPPARTTDVESGDKPADAAGDATAERNPLDELPLVDEGKQPESEEPLLLGGAEGQETLDKVDEQYEQQTEVQGLGHLESVADQQTEGVQLMHNENEDREAKEDEHQELEKGLDEPHAEDVQVDQEVEAEQVEPEVENAQTSNPSESVIFEHQIGGLQQAEADELHSDNLQAEQQAEDVHMDDVEQPVEPEPLEEVQIYEPSVDDPLDHAMEVAPGDDIESVPLADPMDAENMPKSPIVRIEDVQEVDAQVMEQEDIQLDEEHLVQGTIATHDAKIPEIRVEQQEDEDDEVVIESVGPVEVFESDELQEPADDQLDLDESRHQQLDLDVHQDQHADLDEGHDQQLDLDEHQEQVDLGEVQDQNADLVEGHDQQLDLDAHPEQVDLDEVQDQNADPDEDQDQQLDLGEREDQQVDLGRDQVDLEDLVDIAAEVRENDQNEDTQDDDEEEEEEEPADAVRAADESLDGLRRGLSDEEPDADQNEETNERAAVEERGDAVPDGEPRDEEEEEDDDEIQVLAEYLVRSDESSEESEQFEEEPERRDASVDLVELSDDEDDSANPLQPLDEGEEEEDVDDEEQDALDEAQFAAEHQPDPEEFVEELVDDSEPDANDDSSGSEQ